MCARLDHLEDSGAGAGAEVDGDAADVGRAEELVQRHHVALGQVHDMDVVAHAGAVARRVVAAEHAQRWALPQRHLLHIRHQIVGHAHRVLPNLACAHTQDAQMLRNRTMGNKYTKQKA